MRHFLTLILCLMMSSALLAQGTMEMESVTGDSSITVTHQPVPAQNITVLIIPFEPKLYSSDVDREIAAKTGQNFQEIREEFRQGLAKALFVQLDKDYSVASLMADDVETKADLIYVHKSVAYQYRPVPVEPEVPEEEQPKVKQLLGKAKSALKQEEKVEEQPPAGIYGGQVVAPWQGQGEKYMHTSIINPNMIPFLVQKYNADYFLFVNQLDMKTAMTGDYRLYEAGEYQRKIKVHYTILDRFGKEVTGGAATNYMSSRLANVDLIVKGPMTKVCKQMEEKVPTHKPLDLGLPTGVKNEPTEKRVQDY